MSPPAHAGRRYGDNDDSQQDARFRISNGGTGLWANWKAIGAAIVFLVSLTIGATVWCTDISRTSADHTAILMELKGEMHNVNVKVNALLIGRGLNPAQVVDEANREEAVPPTRPN